MTFSSIMQWFIQKYSSLSVILLVNYIIFDLFSHHYYSIQNFTHVAHKYSNQILTAGFFLISWIFNIMNIKVRDFLKIKSDYQMCYRVKRICWKADFCSMRLAISLYNLLPHLHIVMNISSSLAEFPYIVTCYKNYVTQKILAFKYIVILIWVKKKKNLWYFPTYTRWQCWETRIPDSLLKWRNLKHAH